MTTTAQRVGHRVYLSVYDLNGSVQRERVARFLRDLGHDVPEGTDVRLFTEARGVRVEWDTYTEKEP